MNRAVISGDLIAYTSLSDADKTGIEALIKNLLKDLKVKFNIYGRIIKGDYLECYIPQPEYALRIALAIKSYIKSYLPKFNNLKDKRLNAFRVHGVRLAIGIGKINRFDAKSGIIDGEAIYFSGRIINESRDTSNKKRIVIKNTLFIKTYDDNLDELFGPYLALLDVLISNSTAKQCKVLYYKLMGKSEDDIAGILNLYQSTVNEHSTSLGWNAVEKAVLFFEKTIKSYT